MVISSCGHVGIVNTVRQAIDVSGVSKVHAVVRGFHLFAADDDDVRKTVAELKQLDPDVVIPMHCSADIRSGHTRADARSLDYLHDRDRIHVRSVMHRLRIVPGRACRGFSDRSIATRRIER